MTNKNIRLQNVYDEVVRNRNEMKCFVEVSETRLLLKIDGASHRINTLEHENLHLEKQIEYQHTKRIKNLALFGSDKSIHPYIDEKCVCDELNKSLDSNLKASEIANILLFGKETSFKGIKFPSYQITKIIFMKCHKLKETKISKANDFTSFTSEQTN